MRFYFGFVGMVLGGLVTRAFAEEASVQTLRGVRVPCEIDVPATWSVRTNEGTIAAIGDDMQILLWTDARVSHSHAAVKEACDGAREIMPDAKCTGLRPITLADREWMEFVVSGTKAEVPMTFLNYTYSGREGTVTIIGQSVTELADQKRDTLVRYMRTFRFPKAAPEVPGDAKP